MATQRQPRRPQATGTPRTGLPPDRPYTYQGTGELTRVKEISAYLRGARTSPAGGAACGGKVQDTADSLPAPCPHPAIGTYQAACVHEHVRTGPLCRFHRDARAPHGVQHGPLCWECYTADGHECPLGELVPVGDSPPHDLTRRPS